MNRTLTPFLILTLLAACGDDPDKGQDSQDPSDTSPDTESDADTDGDTDSDLDADRPVVLTAQALYFHHTVGGDTWGWSFLATADDPQGVATIERWVHEEQAVFVLDRAGTTLAAYDITCVEGSCSGTCWEDDHGILHTQVDEYTFRFVVVDEDGNASAPMDVKGEPDPTSGT